jgi:short-subunit dehydrogenase
MSELPVILVTGASSGIGEATARLFAAESYRVAMAARRLDRLQSLAQEIQAGGGASLPIAADLTRLEDIQNMVNCTLEEFGRIDVLLNNAGYGRLDWLEKLDPVKDIEGQLHVNLIAVIQTAREVLPHMIARRSGHIINMASLAGFTATPTYTIYAASKFGVRGFTEALRREVGVYGIHVSAIYPGSVKTEFKDHTGAHRKTGRTTPAALKLSAEYVARAALKIARKPRRGLIIPWPMKFSVLANSLFPGLTDWIIERSFTRPERGL